MKHTDKGLLISRIPYSETSTIVRCFTRGHGLKAFLFQGAKKKNAHVLMAMAPLEFSYYQRADSQLAKMTDAQLFYTFHELPFHPVKSGIAFFMAEMLQNVLHEDVKDEQLFDFLAHELQWFDHSTVYTNYPIFWLLEMTQHLGFYPFVAASDGKYFDLEDGQFVNAAPLNHTYQQGETAELLRDLTGHSKDEILASNLPKAHRKKLLSLLLEYYKHHIPNFKALKSIEVMESLWS